MSGPTWLPPRTLDSPERAVPQMSHSAGAPIYRAPNKKGMSDFRPKYGPYDQNGGGGGGGGMAAANRYMATGPTGGPIHHSSGDHYYPPHGSKEDRTWSPHMDSYELMHRGPEKPPSYHSKIDADIDSLTSMLADLDSQPQESSTQLYDNVPYNKYLSGDHYKPVHQSAAPPQGRPAVGYSQYHPAPPYPSEHHAPQYPAPHQQDYYPSSAPKPYPQPVPASYTTASTPTGPRFSVQVKTAQPVTYSQTGRQAEQAYTPPPPRQHVSRPPSQTQAGPQGWYPAHPGPQAQEMHSDGGYKGGGGAGPGGRVSQVPVSKKGMENSQTSAGPAQSPAYQLSMQGAATTRPEEELDRLTKKLVYDMNHPPAEEYFGRCARCGDNVVGDGSGCIAMEQVFHVECFTCITCHARLRGQPFYALDKKSYCESCYISTLERCSKCSKPILDRILRAMGKAYHPRCFTCVVCNCCLDGVPFTVDATSQIHCIDDFHRKYAPRCSVCGEPIMPEPGQEETVRIVALDRSFHVNCYICEECGLLLSSEGEGRGCYPLDGHILCKSCSARRIQDLSAKISTDC
ncbi:thyroid receptor-interacting protein 6 isoform X1 [Salarias fasciatus]|uniref:LIM zinc-binding domain-containing protein n=1 Tax=Salarias fasciatus TaxID=181472 RepID=A0A672GG65_SALFA|nr:thyroid receptor-interacting protein 6 isoform X1 [Salarias fasciatus]XP_029975522.1 thyroid receptor-interacting protein 6 isoform X1 [Salarias fasciatus]XP_029975529.1 thyroid receptor-interacting protein 6 isoform X1 [Salarias fasciatus]XP_029975538.1 thyroid receptor-interacting protein 6 isoform X1 [Salarias fasciatus]XP_029975547.1 thyroid receptor-interacting protein 6 isoform X1 [Salarias fasciatus]